MVRVTDYWPEVADDLTRVSWSHATNSKALLDQALADSTMMIEADVSLGAGNTPIMAHPPASTSDLSLQQFLESVLATTESGAKKGIKLDFKFLGVVEPSLQLLDGLRERLAIPLWLNADILQGPGGGEHQIGFVLDDFCPTGSHRGPKLFVKMAKNRYFFHTYNSNGQTNQVNKAINFQEGNDTFLQVTQSKAATF